MIINIRGTHGSGKSTLVRNVFKLAKKFGREQRLHGVLGPRLPEAYHLEFDGVDKPLFVLGPYDFTPTGGCDQIQPYDKIFYLLDKYTVQGHVLFEGVLISSSFGRVGEYLTTKWGDQAIVIFLTTPLETCIANVRQRRAARPRTDASKEFDPKNVTRKWDNIQRSRKRIAESKVRMVDMDPFDEDAALKIVKMLQDAT